MCAIALDVAKWAGQVKSIGFAGQTCCGSIRSRVKSGHELGRVDPYFSNKFFFFFLEIDAICQLFMNSLTVIKFSLVILLSLTNYH